MINILKFGNKFNITKNILSIICDLLIFCLPYAISFNFLAYINPMFIFLFTAFWLPICVIN